MPTNRPTALVTGGAVRLGREIVLALARRGYDIALHYSGSESAASQTQAEVLEHGAQCTLFQSDLCEKEAPLQLMAGVIEAFPTLSLLVNNASLFDPPDFLQTTMALFDEHFALNLRAPFFLTQSFAKNVKSGQVINLVDTRITQVRTDHFAYTLTKKSLADLTRMTARALGPAIRVNGICPGLILPPPGEDEGYLTMKAAALPLAESGSPQEIVRALDYLLASPNVTGELLFVDSGEHLL